MKNICIFRELSIYFVTIVQFIQYFYLAISYQSRRFNMQAYYQESVNNTIATIAEKIKLVSIGGLHPPYLPKFLTKFRQEFYSKLKNQYKLSFDQETLTKMEAKEKLRKTNMIAKFINKFDKQYVDIYIQQIRQPYIRKIFQQNYGFDDIDFKQANQQYHLRKQIENAITQASDWLLKIEQTQDLLNRVELYFDVKIPSISEKLKKKGSESNKSWIDSINNMFRNLSAFALRKTSKMVQMNFFTAVAPLALVLSFAIIGGNSTLPWTSDFNISNIIPAFAVVVVPFLLDSMASTIEKGKIYNVLQKWALTYEKLALSIEKYNQMLENQIDKCCVAKTQQQFNIEYTNLKKFIGELKKNLDSFQENSQQKFQQMRKRSQAYFKQYIEIEDGDWTIVIPKDQGQEIFQELKQNSK